MTPPPPITGIAAVFVMLLVAMVLAGALICVSVFLGPRRPTAAKESPYESGMTPVGTTHDRFSVHYYMVAMLYIIFDVETIFLYPWASILHKELGRFGFYEVMVFMGILAVGLVYIYGKGVIDWE